jgi:hypothetical protein
MILLCYEMATLATFGFLQEFNMGKMDESGDPVKIHILWEKESGKSMKICNLFVS